jgi:cytochrome b561
LTPLRGCGQSSSFADRSRAGPTTPDGDGSGPRTKSMAGDPQRYAGPMIALHWLTAALIAVGFPLGLWMVGLPFGPPKLRMYAWHKWLGLTVLAFSFVRLGWRVAGGVPAPWPLPAWQRRAAAWTHALLYAALFAIPLSGWLLSSATGVSVVWLGLVPLPDLVARDKALAALLRSIHGGLNYALAALVFVHVGAAARHHFIDHDGVLGRMLARGPSSRGSTR